MPAVVEIHEERQVRRAEAVLAVADPERHGRARLDRSIVVVVERATRIGVRRRADRPVIVIQRHGHGGEVAAVEQGALAAEVAEVLNVEELPIRLDPFAEEAIRAWIGECPELDENWIKVPTSPETRTVGGVVEVCLALIGTRRVLLFEVQSSEGDVCATAREQPNAASFTKPWTYQNVLCP